MMNTLNMFGFQPSTWCVVMCVPLTRLANQMTSNSRIRDIEFPLFVHNDIHLLTVPTTIDTHQTVPFRLRNSILACTGGMKFAPTHVDSGFSGNGLNS